MQNKFVPGLRFKKTHEKAPDFVLLNGSIKLEEMMALCQERLASGEEWLNFDVLRPKDETKNPYATINDWKPSQPEQPTVQTPTPAQQATAQGYGQSVNEGYDDNSVPF